MNVAADDELYENIEPMYELNMLPEEYIALNYDFFEIYNNDERFKKKYQLHEEIICTSQAVVESLKEIIDQIIRVYEVEVL